ncbi:hypothetical protein LCGC14_1527890 [marine sediment metagenome]|uniref:CBM-cenC domain-containing protein n=1 Tax=marine sediment metagenome TaxID=412755 RepID=A0A0F9LCC0_9ZZZZ
MAEKENALTYILVGGEETFKNPLSQSPLAFRSIENLIPGIRGDFEQKLDPPIVLSSGTNIDSLFNYERVESDGSVTRLLIHYDSSTKKLYKTVGAALTKTEIFPASTGFADLKQTPVFVQATNNLLYFTDGERWFVTDGTTVQLAGLPHPVDASTFSTGAGTLDIVTNRFYWVAWAVLNGEFFQWGASSPISAGTGTQSNKKFTVTRPNHPPPRATHWILFASESEDDQTFGAHLATVPIGTATFEDQSPFLGDAGSAMVGTRRPIRNQGMIPGEWTRLHKGRIFVGGFHKTPYVIRNPGFEDPSGATLNGWTATGTTGAITADSGTVFDQAGSCKLSMTTGNDKGLEQDMSKILKSGRKYRFEVASRKEGGIATAGYFYLRLHDGTTNFGEIQFVISTDSTGSWFARSFDVDLTEVKSTLKLQMAKFALDGTLVGFLDYIRVWELVPPSQVAYTALEEVEGLQNGRGEESMPGSTPAPENNDNSDIVNLLNYPSEGHQLVGALPFNDTLVVFSDTSGVPLEGDSFDDFGFSEYITLAVGLAHKYAITKSRHGLFFVSDGHKIFQAPLASPVVELSQSIRGDIKDLDSSLPVWLAVFDFADRSWLSVTYTDTGSTKRHRLLDLETRQWFKFTDFAPTPVIEYKPVAGKKVLLGATATTIFVLDDPQTAYTASSNNVPASKFKQVLLDLGDPSRFKVWKQFLIHTNSTPTVKYWFDPFDPDSPGSSEALTMVAKTNLAQLLEGSFQVGGSAYGKRCLIEVTLPSVAAAKKVLGMEVYAEATTRRTS